MNWNTERLNSAFDCDGPEFLTLTDDDVEVLSRGMSAFIGQNHTEEAKALIGSYHKGKIVSEETRKRLSKVSKGIKNPNKGGYGANNVNSVRWILHHKCGKITDIVGIANWCKDNGYRRSGICDIAAGRRKTHKDIIKVEKLNK